MKNLKQETIEILNENGKTVDDILWIGVRDKKINGNPLDILENFDFVYDAGYGANEINLSLLVVGKDFWLERCEYDGLEWWEFKTLPQEPKETVEYSKELIYDGTD